MVERPDRPPGQFPLLGGDEDLVQHIEHVRGELPRLETGPACDVGEGLQQAEASLVERALVFGERLQERQHVSPAIPQGIPLGPLLIGSHATKDRAADALTDLLVAVERHAEIEARVQPAARFGEGGVVPFQQARECARCRRVLVRRIAGKREQMCRAVAPGVQKHVHVLQVVRLVLCRPEPDVFEIHRLASAMGGLDGAGQGAVGGRRLRIDMENGVGRCGKNCLGHGVLEVCQGRREKPLIVHIGRFLCRRSETPIIFPVPQRDGSFA